MSEDGTGDRTDDRLARAMRGAAIGMCLVAADGTILEANDAVCAFLGRDLSDLLNRTWQELTHPEDLQADVALVQRLLNGDADSYRLTKRYLRSDGSVVHGDLSVSVVHDRHGGFGYFVSQIADVTDRERAKSEAEESRALLRGVLDSMPDPWVLLDPMRDGDGTIVDFRYVDANDAACAANGMSRSELLGCTLLDLLPEHSPTGLLEAYADVIETGRPLALDDEPFADRLDPGKVRRFDNRGVRIGGRLSFTWRDVTDRYEARRVLAEQARLDDLTGLPNRMQLRERLAAAFARRPRTGQSIAILYCDLDDFKPINDLHGHATGDGALREIARRIAASVRAQDTIARLGGDEFVAVLEGVHTADDAAAVAEKVRTAVRAPITIGEHAVQTTMSIGIALAEPGEPPDLVLEHADSALYAAKALGGDRAELYQAVDHAAI